MLKGRRAHIIPIGLLLTLMLMVFGGGSARGQRVPADSYAWVKTSAGLGSSSVTNPGSATGDPDGNFAFLEVANILGSASATIQLKFLNATNPTIPLPQGTQIYIRVGGSMSSSLLGLLLGGSGGISAYSGTTSTSTTVLSGSASTTTLSNFTGADGFKYAVVTTGTATANAVLLKIDASLLLGGGNLEVYHAFYIAPPIISNQSICFGASATVLNTDNYITYNWYTASTGGTPVHSGRSISPTSTTTYYVEAAYTADFHSIRKPVTITVNAIPSSPTVSSSSLSICAGSNAAMSDTSPVAGVTYNWYSVATGGTSLATGTSYSPTPGTSTIYYVEAVSNNCPSPRTAITVTVNAIPTAPTVASSTIAICSGSLAAMSVTSPVVGVTYNWYSVSTGGTILATGTSYSPLPTGSVVYYVEAVTSSGCPSTRTSVNVTVNPSPAAPNTITGTPTVCVDQTTTLANTTVGGAWSSSDPTIATVNTSGIVTGIAGGTATISYTITNGTCETSATRLVTVNVLPIVPPITGSIDVCINQSIALSNSTSGGVWSSSNTAVATINSITGAVFGVSPGTTTITYTVINTSTCSKSVTHNLTIHTTLPKPVVSLQ